jgi:ElaB/YqjD/DUF883 family membrane-anchored ribosome-binding protein
MTQGPKRANPQKIESDINQTRSAITSDIQELSQKLEPERLKEQAKGAISDAADHIKSEAREAITEAKDAAVEKFHDVKDAAIGTVTDTVQSVGGEVRHAAHETWGFARRNAVPLAFIGVGAAWLIASNRRGPRSRDPYDPRGEWQRDSRLASGVQQAEDTLRDGFARGNGKVKSTARRLTTQARDLGERAEHTLHDGSARARDFAEHEWERVRSSSTELARENPLALGAIALAAGVGVGLLLPSTDKEDELLGPVRERLVSDARDTARELGSAAKDVANVAKDTARDVKQTLTYPSSSV